MNPKEQTRLQVLNSLMAEHMTLDQAATLMGVSPRHTRRILAAYREKGAASVAHGHRGRRAPNATPEAVAYDVVHLARTRYSGANHTHLSELLDEREGIAVGRTMLRRILLNAGLKSPQRRRPPKHRVRRQRMPRQGMLIQMDGSFHPWLGDQVPPFTLLIAVDVIADEKMSEIAGVELTHPMAGASFTKSSWRCSTDFAEGGTSERDLRDERGGPFHTGYCRGIGHRSKYGAEIPEVSGGHAAQGPALQGIEPFDKLRRTLTPSTLTGGCPRGWKTAWSCTASSRPWATTVAIRS